MEELTEYKVLKLISFLSIALFPNTLIQVGTMKYKEYNTSHAEIFADYEFIGRITDIDINKAIKKGLIKLVE